MKSDDQVKKDTLQETTEDVVFEEENNETEDVDLRGKVKELRTKLKDAEAKAQEYLTGWQRAKADLINARKRDEEDKKDLVKFANESLIAELLPVLESFDMAMGDKEEWEKIDKNWRIGVEYIASQLKKTLADNGLGEIDPLGEPTDPNRDEAVKHELVFDES